MNSQLVNNSIYDNPRNIIASTLVELGESNKDVVYISCDSSLGASGGSFKENFPNRHFEFGLQEQSSMGTAAGMATMGKIPFIAAYVPFITYRCFEQIRDDICKTNLNVNVIGNNCGLSVCTLGPTHTVLEDVAVLRAIPNITIISPADGPEYREAIFAAAQIKGPVYIRVHREKAKRLNPEDYKFETVKGVILKKGSDVTIISNSTMVLKSLETAEILDKKGVSAEVINMHTLKPVDSKIILESSTKTKRVVTIEEHTIIGGLGSIVSDVLIRNNPVRLKMIGINDEFAIVGKYDELLNYYGLTAEKISVSIFNFINS